MKRINFALLGVALLAGLIVAGISAVRMSAQSTGPQGKLRVTSEQQQQLDHLNQLDQQLEKDRDAVDAAVAEYGLDSDQADVAHERLFRDREEYWKLRRSLRTSGVTIPQVRAMGPGMGGPRSGRGRRHCCRGIDEGCCWH